MVLNERELKTLLKSFSVINPNFKVLKVFHCKIPDYQGFQGHLVWFQGFQGPAATLWQNIGIKFPIQAL